MHEALSRNVQMITQYEQAANTVKANGSEVAAKDVIEPIAEMVTSRSTKGKRGRGKKLDSLAVEPSITIPPKALPPDTYQLNAAPILPPLPPVTSSRVNSTDTIDGSNVANTNPNTAYLPVITQLDCIIALNNEHKQEVMNELNCNQRKNEALQLELTTIQQTNDANIKQATMMK